MSVFDRAPWERDVADCPRHIGRPPAPQPLAQDATDEERREYRNVLYRWRHDWTIFHEGEPRGGLGQLVDQGWEIRDIWPPSRAMQPRQEADSFNESYERERRERREQVGKWADAFIAGNGSIGVYPEDRYDVMEEVARRLREATADGFLVRALSAEETQQPTSRRATATPESPCGRCGSVGEERGDPERSTPELFVPCVACSPGTTHLSHSEAVAPYA